MLVGAKRKVAEGIDGKHRDEDKHDRGDHARGPTVTRQKQRGDRKDSAGEDPAPPFQGRIEPDEIVAVEAVRRVEKFGEDEKREKQHGQESGKGSRLPGERHGESEHEQRPPHDQELDDWRVRVASDERRLHVAGPGA